MFNISICQTTEYDKERYLTCIRVFYEAETNKCKVAFSTNDDLFVEPYDVPFLYTELKKFNLSTNEKDTYKLVVNDLIFYTDKKSIGLSLSRIDAFIRYFLNEKPDSILFTYEHYTDDVIQNLDKIKEKAKRRAINYKDTMKLPYGSRKLAFIEKGLTIRKLVCNNNKIKTLFINKELANSNPIKHFTTYSVLKGVCCSMCEKTTVTMLDDNRTDSFLLGLCEEHLYQLAMLLLISYYDRAEGTFYQLGDFKIIYDSFDDEYCYFTGESDTLLYKLVMKSKTIYFSKLSAYKMLKSLIKSAAFSEIFESEYHILKEFIFNKIDTIDDLDVIYKIISSDYLVKKYNFETVEQRYLMKICDDSAIANAKTYIARISHDDEALLPANIKKYCIQNKSDYYYFENQILKGNKKINLSNKKKFATDYPVTDFYISYINDFNYHIVPHKHKEKEERVTGVLELVRINDEYDKFSIPFCQNCLDAIIPALSKTNATNPIFDVPEHNSCFKYYPEFPKGKHCYFSGSNEGACYEIKLGYVHFYLSEYWKKRMNNALKKMRRNVKAIARANYNAMEK